MDLMNIDIKDFDTVYEDLISQFPQCELKTYDSFIKLIQTSLYGVYKAYDEDKTTGYCILYKEIENNVLWLDYIAVYKEFHSKGYGKKILNSISKKFNKSKGIYLEVEKPDEKVPNTLRRINFYESLGAQKLDCKYFYPNQNGCCPLDLYFLPFDGSYIPSKQETLNTISKVFKTIHRDLPHLEEILQKIC